MAKQPYTDCTVLAGNASEALDLSGYTNASSFAPTYESQDTTTYADTARRRKATVSDASFSITSFHDDGGQPWDTLNDLSGSADQFVAWIESNASMAEGDRGIFGRVLQSSYEGPNGDVGSMQMINVSGEGDGPMIFGRLLQQDESLTVTGNSTGIQFGALSSGETLYCVMWVLSVTAGSIAATIESDDNSGFTSATTRATFTSATGTTTELETVSGAVTDDWWRFAYTITTGPAVVVCMIGKR